MRKPHKLFREIRSREMSPLARKVMLSEVHRYLGTRRRCIRMAVVAELKRRRLVREGKVWQ